MKKLIRTAAFLVVICLLACARGESHTVDQIFQAAKQRYATSARGKSSVKELNSLSEKLETYAKANSPEAVQSTARAIAEDLQSMTAKAGYTTRPALDQLMKQYRVLAKSAGAATPATLRLLVARTYHTLASELETTGFGL